MSGVVCKIKHESDSCFLIGSRPQENIGCFMRRSNRNFIIPPPPPGKARAFELFKIGSFKFPPPRVKMGFKCPTLSSHFVCQMPLLKNNRRRFLSSVIKLVYIRGTQRYKFSSRGKAILDVGYAVHGKL